MPRRVRPRTAGEEGFALLGVIVLLTVVATVVAGFALAARNRLDLAADLLARERLGLLADGLVTVVAQTLAGAGTAHDIPVDGATVTCAAGDLSIFVQVQHQHGLVDLNAAGEDLLELALRSLDLGAAAAGEAAATILAYRDPEPGTADVAQADRTRDGLAGGPFLAIEELHGISALSSVPAAQLAATFTTESGSPDVAGPYLPAKLARAVPRGPTPAAPFVLADAPRAGRHAVAVYVRGPDGTLGRAAKLYEIDAEGARVRARLNATAGAPGADAPMQLAPCPALFGAAAAHLQGAVP